MHRPLLLLLFALLSATVFSTPASAQTVLVIGDSLSAAYNMKKEDGWVNLLQQRLDDKGNGIHRVINSSISGDTTAGGLSRLPAALKTHQPTIVIIELGANDGLRGLSLQQIQRNLGRMIELAQQSNAVVLLAGMRLPPNYGEVYTQKFHQVFTDLAEREEIRLIPFFLANVGGVAELIQADGMHPNAKAQPIILNNVWVHLEPLLDDHR